MKKDPTEILPGIEIRGLCLYLRNEDTLVFADLHLGYEEELRKMGMLVPRFQYAEVIAHLEKVIFSIKKKGRIARAVINGDLKHEFGRISEQEWSEVVRFLSFLEKHFDETVLVRGNHDNILGPIAGRKGLSVVDHIFLDKENSYIAHGQKIPDDVVFKKAQVVIIAHDHPAVSLRDSARTEKVKCFLVGKWKKKTLIQMPSMCFATMGSDPMAVEALSPFLEKNRESFDAYCVEGLEIFYFGKLRNI
jgi:putative SbcD/Mre11-related phosphoesterase